MSGSEEQAEEDTSEPDTLYVYSVPLETVDGVDSPTYSTSNVGSKEFIKYTSRDCIVGTTDVNPHFHKDSINVGVQKFEVSSEEDIESVKSEVL